MQVPGVHFPTSIALVCNSHSDRLLFTLNCKCSSASVFGDELVSEALAFRAAPQRGLRKTHLQHHHRAFLMRQPLSLSLSFLQMSFHVMRIWEARRRRLLSAASCQLLRAAQHRFVRQWRPSALQRVKVDQCPSQTLSLTHSLRLPLVVSQSLPIYCFLETRRVKSHH